LPQAGGSVRVLVEKPLAVRLGLAHLDDAEPPAGLGPPAWDMKPFAGRSIGISCASIEA
jgi:hypothetical protein